MTAVEDPAARTPPSSWPGQGGRAGAPPQGGRAPHHRPDAVDRQHRAAGHAAHGDAAQPGRARADHPTSTSARPRTRPGVVAVFTGADFAEEQGIAALRLAGDAGHGQPRAPVDRRRPGEPRRRGGGDRRRPRPARRPPTRSRRSTSTTSRCPWCWTWSRPSRTARRWCTTRRRRTPATTSSSTPARPAPARTPSRPSPTPRSRSSRRFVQQRLIPAFMEPRSVVVQPSRDNYTMWSATQIPHILRVMAASVTGIPEHKLRVIAPDVGGGFGGKLQVNPEEILALLVARRLGKPIKWTETRGESLMTAHHGRDQVQFIDVAADRDGTVRGLRVRLLADMGAYLRLVTPGVPALGAFMFPGIYKFPAYRFECDGRVHQQGAHRRLPRRGPARGDVRHRADHGRARRRAGHGPAGAAPEELDQRRGVPVHHGGRAPVRQRRLRRRPPSRRWSCSATTSCAPSSSAAGSRNDPVQLGIGFSTFTEMCGLAPSRVLGSLVLRRRRLGAASIRMLPTGKVEVVTGSTPHGQGHETAWSQIVADQLGVPFEDVEVLHGDTAISSQRPGHLRLPVAGGRRHGGGQGGGEGRAEGPGDRRAPAGGQRGRPGVQPAASSPSRGRRAPASGSRRCALAIFAAHDYPEGDRALDRLRGDLRPGELLLPARHAHLRDGDRHRDRVRQDPQVRLRRRRRDDREPADRRGPGARRPGPGHRAGACSRRRSTTPRAT